MRFPRSTTIQSIIFDRKKWTVSRAKKWLSDHGKKISTPDTTAKYHRFRQERPDDFVKSTFRTIDIGTRKSTGIKAKSTGIKAVIGMKKKKNPKKTSSSIRLPRRIVMLGKCLEVHFSNGEIWRPNKRRADLCASESGKTLWVVEVSREHTYKKPKSDLYEAFSGYYVSGVKIAKIREPKILKKTGIVEAVVYESDKWDGKKREYIHEFKYLPSAYTDNLKKPSFLKISGAKIRVKPEGITG